MQNYHPLGNESKLIILLLVIVLFGLLIMTANKKKKCGCKRKVVYRNNQLNHIPEWAVKLKQRNREMFQNTY
jgi:hypothetical protein